MKTFPAITSCEVNMDQDEASRLTSDVDATEHSVRVQRLVELAGVLPDSGMIGFSGQAAEWLFEDVKATWLYGCFTSTVLTAHAFCCVQLAGVIRLLPDAPEMPTEPDSLEHLADLAARAAGLDIDTQARLVDLHDRYRAYSAADLHEFERRLERHVLETQAVTDEHPLLVDAREALITSVRLLYRR